MASAPTVCRSCGKPSAEDARFCAACGTELAAPAREERKIVTALFADVVGSTTLGERLDAEDFRNVIDGAVGCMIKAVEEFGGSLNEFTGDGVLGLFGSPVAHEDDPQRAVLAGLRIAELVERFERDAVQTWNVDSVAVRIGIETGPAVLARVGALGSEVHGATGDTLNTAARLQAAAQPGTVLVGERTQRLAERSFEWGEPVELALKGKAEAVVAFEARCERVAGAEPGRAIHARIVGRDRELAEIGEAIADVRSGTGCVAFLVGEAGLGKSRILWEARAQFERPAAGTEATGLWLQGRCMSYAETLPYWPFQGMLREWLAGADPAADLRDSLERRLAELFGEQAGDLLPFVAAVLGLPPTPADRERLSELSPEVLQRLTVDSVRSVVAALAAISPVAVAIDDLHWADSSSLALIEQLLETTDSAAVLLVLASRPERDQPAWRLAETAREAPHRFRELVLGALEDEADRALLAELVGGGTLPVEVERQVLSRCEGNPFYIQELVRSLVDGGALVREGEGWSFDSEVAVELPDTVEKVVLARIDRLSSERRRVLDAAAVLGRQFALAVLEAVAGTDCDVRGAMRELQRMALVQEGTRWPEPEYRFAHSLIQEAAYASLLRRDRRELHRRAGEAIENVYADYLDERYGLLAGHWAEAGDLGRALESHGRAGDAARRMFALAEAVEHYDRALDAAARLGLADDDETVYRLRLERGRAQVGDLRASEDDYRAALAAARSAGDRGTEMHALTELAELRRMTDFREAGELVEAALAIAREREDVALQVRLQARRSIMDSNRLWLDAAFEHANAALSLARRAGDEGDRATAMDALKLAALQVGDLETLERTAEELAVLAERRGDLVQLMYALLEASYASSAYGRWDAATSQSGRALELCDRIGNTIARALIMDGVSWPYRCRGDYGWALRNADAALAYAIEQGILEWEAWTEATLGGLLLELRLPSEALPHIERGIAAAERSAAEGVLARCTSLAARARVATGDVPGAEQALGSALEALGRMRVPPGRAWLFGGHCYVALADTLVELERPAEGRALVEPVLAAAERSGWLEMVARCAIAVGSSAAALGDRGAARAAFERGLAVAMDAGMPEPEAGARAGLAALDVEAEAHIEAAQALFRRLAASIDEPRLAAGLLNAAVFGAGSRPT